MLGFQFIKVEILLTKQTNMDIFGIIILALMAAVVIAAVLATLKDNRLKQVAISRLESLNNSLNNMADEVTEEV